MSVGELAVLLIAALSVAFIGWAVVRLTSSKAATGQALMLVCRGMSPILVPWSS